MREFDLQPTLRGELLRLRPLHADDFESLFAVSSDPLIWEMHPEKTRYRRDVFERFFAAALESKGALVAADSKTGEIIGSSRFNALDPEKKSVEVGYTFLACKCWGKGFNTEMKALMLKHAFESVEKVYFYIGENNFRSRRAVEKIGARLLEKFERQPKEGAKYFATVYGIDKTDFLKNDAAFRRSGSAI
jgi:RimJ/RimL family protein N-acetyltransferase